VRRLVLDQTVVHVEDQMRPFHLSAFGVAGVLLFVHVHAAGADDKPDPATLFAEGRQLMAAEDYAAACARLDLVGARCSKLAESQALDPEPDTALDLAICYQTASRIAFKAAHDLAPSPNQPDEGRAQRVAALQTPTPPVGQTQRVTGLVLGGAGLMAIVGGAIAGIVAKGKYDDVPRNCHDSMCLASITSEVQAAHSLSTAATISLSAGALATAAATIVFFTAPKATASGLSVGFRPITQGGGLSVGGRF
jgi:hypothetical protein